ncbi:hypothetical protein [Vampirovibrio chlorellavorus]|uniref:hypothetical protein n=1 Tax=Vampirovibrio chlorellavorus TaxID=758823 RepID=UPI0026F1983E|nr:hypothetical protein [Vampirovibrio chlorellavorus]
MTQFKFNALAKSILSANLALSFVVMPAVALADGTLQLKPLQDTTVYSNNAYNNNGYGNAGYNNNTGYNSNGYGNDYYSNNNNYSYDNTTLRGRLISIPKGTLMTIHTDVPITTYAAHVGDPITATLENDIFVNDAVAIPAGSQVLGQVANVNSASHLGKHGDIDVRFDSIKLPDGRVVAINAHIVTKDQSGVLRGDTYAMDIAKGVGIAAGATGVGTLMGTAAGGLLGSVGTGALFGLGVGALGGMGYALARKGKEVVVPAGSRLSVMVDTPVTVSQ